MFDILSSLIFFFLSVGIHVLWCRLFPKKDLQILLYCAIAMIMLMVSGGYLFFLRPQLIPIGNSFWNIPLPLSSLALFVLLIPVYLMLYFMTQQESPTKRLLLFLEKRGKATYAELAHYMTDKAIIEPRMSDLIRYGFVIKEGNGYRLLASGHRTSLALIAYEKACHKEMGG